MKATVDTKILRSALKSMTVLHGFGKQSAGEGSQGCLLTVTDKDTLVLETTNGGAYIKRVIPAQTLRAGQVAVDGAQILKQNLSGTVTLESSGSQLRLSFRQSAKAEMEVEASLAEMIIDSRPRGKKKMAEMPFALFKAAVTAVTYPSVMKEQELHVQIRLRRGKRRSRLEVSGIDNISYAFYRAIATDIKVESDDFRFILGSDLLKKALAEIDAEGAMFIGLGRDDTAIFIAENFELHHPKLDEDWIDIEHLIEGEPDGWFEITHKQLLGAVDTVRRIDAPPDAPLRLTVEYLPTNGAKSKKKKKANEEKKVRISTASNRAQLQEDLIVLDAAVPEGDLSYQTSETTLSNFLKLLPSELPLRLESWEKHCIRVMPNGMKSGTKVEYMLPMFSAED